MRWIFADFPKILDLSEICPKSLDLPVDPQESDQILSELGDRGLTSCKRGEILGFPYVIYIGNLEGNHGFFTTFSTCGTSISELRQYFVSRFVFNTRI